MMRKYTTVAAIFGLLLSTPAQADPTYNGTMTGSPIFSSIPNQDAMSTVTFSCEDVSYGHHDICVDVAIRIPRSFVRITMGATFSPKLTIAGKSILLRYTFSIPEEASQGSKQVHLGDVPLTTGIVFQVAPGRPVTVYRESKDGGDTWSDMNPVTHY